MSHSLDGTCLLLIRSDAGLPIHTQTRARARAHTHTALWVESRSLS